MGTPEAHTPSLLVSRCCGAPTHSRMYAGYNAQVCEYWKQRINKEEGCVMGMLEQSRTTPRNPIVPARSSKGKKSRPTTAASYASERSSRPGTSNTQRTSSTMATEEEALLRSTLNRLDQLEAKLDHERSARHKAEAELRELQGMVQNSARSNPSQLSGRQSMQSKQ